MLCVVSQAIKGRLHVLPKRQNTGRARVKNRADVNTLYSFLNSGEIGQAFFEKQLSQWKMIGV